MGTWGSRSRPRFSLSYLCVLDVYLIVFEDISGLKKAWYEMRWIVKSVTGTVCGVESIGQDSYLDKKEDKV